MKFGTTSHGRLSCLLITALAVALTPTLGIAQDLKPTVAELASADLPDAKEIIARYIEAIGGEEAIRKTVSKHITGKFLVPSRGVEGNLVLFRSVPDKLLIRIDVPGKGEMMQGFDGKVGFMSSPQGPSILKGSQLGQIRETADFYTELHRADKFESMETVELTEFEGKLCYKVKLISKAGREFAEFFDKETGLLAGNLGKQEAQGTTFEQTTVYSDYKTFGDLLLPTRTAVRIMGSEQVMTYETVEFNTVDKAVYELPDTVKALVSAEPSIQPDDN